MPKQITIGDILHTDAEAKAAVKLYKEASPGTFAKRCAAELIEPNMEKINKRIGQENNALYLAYCVEYALDQSSTRS